ncbi:MAG TPA: thioredoxin domain-containing protein, partial [Phycisphaerae bacterium]|nr:thioredoxin domain-containing protein [Phycisphaerae bacterium]
MTTNRLIDSTSPYLLQHAHNPVDWYPWGAEALGRARKEGKPIFLSIGYAACHWCHVMERECFERPEIAAVMNRDFVNIKVDREERPDLDDLYMLATQAMSGSGGWPMSVWLTPELKPFYAGTYFPPVDGYGRPGFPRLLAALANTWQNRRAELLEQAEKVEKAVKLHVDESGRDEGQKTKDEMDAREWLRLAVEQMADRFDAVNGGFGGAPKFPPHQGLAFYVALLRAGTLPEPDRGVVAGQLARTLDGMMGGGIYDHVGGAFARYSTDEKWLVPHFEKMLYDSAQLAPVYGAAAALLGNPDYARIAAETLDFFLREMRSPDGAFYSSLDADSDGEEGKYYVWSLADLRAAVPNPDDAELVIQYFGLTPETNWHETPVPGASVLAVAQPADDLAAAHGTTAHAIRHRLDAALAQMREFRERRVRPGLDDKILTSWNGLMLSALATAGSLLPRETPSAAHCAAAVQLAEFLLQHHMPDGKLLRVSRAGGAAHTPGFLDDHAFLLNGLVDLLDATDESPEHTRFLASARALADSMLEQFEDQDRGGFFFTGLRHEQLFARMKNAADNATPSANGVAIRALLRLARISGEDRYRRSAQRAIGAFATNIARRPEYFATIMRALVEDGTTATPAQTSDPASDPNDVLRLSVVKFERDPSAAFFEVTVRIHIADGYHIQPASDVPPGIPATTLRLRALGNMDVVSQQWKFPPVHRADGTDGYAGTLDVLGQCRFAALPGEHRLRVSLTAQACTA